jgi:hypothetical protein
MKSTLRRNTVIIRLVFGLALTGMVAPAFGDPASPPAKHRRPVLGAVLRSCVTRLELPALPAPTPDRGVFRSEMRAYFTALSPSQHSDLLACRKAGIEENRENFRQCVVSAGLPAIPQGESSWQERRIAMHSYVASLTAAQKAELRSCRQQPLGKS